VSFANRHKSEKQKATTNTAKGPVEVELPGSERESAIESATLLATIGDLYAERNDVAEAEKLYKQVMSLADEEKLETKVAVEALFKLGILYENAGRFIDTETLYKDGLTKPTESLGEQNLYIFALHKRLGDLYANWNRPEDAERSYRNLLQMTQSQSVDMWDILARETLAKFLANHDRYEEAASLFEQVIASSEPRLKTAFWLVGESLRDDYFQLGRSYYGLRRFELAENNFKKAFGAESNKEEPDLNNQSTTLVWQWFTANQLKKHEESARFYQELIRLVQADLARTPPNRFFGATLRDLVRSFRDSKEFSKADELLRLALAIEKKAHGDESLETGRVWESLGNLDLARGQYGNAITSFKIAQTIYEKVTPPSMADLSYVLFRIGMANYYQLDFEQARLPLIRSTSLLDQHPEAADPENYSRYQLAIVERRLGHFEAAKKILQPTLDEREPADPSKTLRALLELTTIARSQGALQEANQWWARAQTSSEKIDPTELRENWSLFHYQRAMMAFVNGEVSEASTLMQAAIAFGENDTRSDLPLFIEYLDDYALILRRRGNDKDAVLVEQRAKQLRDQITRGKKEN
jgi:Flp pilus assembly protein TadD